MVRPQHNIAYGCVTLAEKQLCSPEADYWKTGQKIDRGTLLWESCRHDSRNVSCIGTVNVENSHYSPIFVTALADFLFIFKLKQINLSRHARNFTGLKHASCLVNSSAVHHMLTKAARPQGQISAKPHETFGTSTVGGSLRLPPNRTLDLEARWTRGGAGPCRS